MKPWSVILTVVLLLFSIVRLAATCNKHKKTALKKDFSGRLQTIESARAGIFASRSPADEIIPADREQTRLYNRTVDSAIEHYRTVYFSDEKRYRQYLKVLYEYKKLSYEYQNLVKLNGDTKLDPEKKRARYRAIQSKMRDVETTLDRYRLAALWDIYD